jgi:hypothetical protein
MTLVDFVVIQVEEEFHAVKEHQHWDEAWQKETLFHKKQRHERCKFD